MQNGNSTFQDIQYRTSTVQCLGLGPLKLGGNVHRFVSKVNTYLKTPSLNIINQQIQLHVTLLDLHPYYSIQYIVHSIQYIIVYSLPQTISAHSFVPISKRLLLLVQRSLPSPKHKVTETKMAVSIHAYSENNSAPWFQQQARLYQYLPLTQMLY